jgi:hypothetical protein
MALKSQRHKAKLVVKIQHFVFVFRQPKCFAKKYTKKALPPKQCRMKRFLRLTVLGV